MMKFIDNAMSIELCSIWKNSNTMAVTVTPKAIARLDGKINVIIVKTYHCEACRSFVRGKVISQTLYKERFRCLKIISLSAPTPVPSIVPSCDKMEAEEQRSGHTGGGDMKKSIAFITIILLALAAGPLASYAGEYQISAPVTQIGRAHV